MALLIKSYSTSLPSRRIPARYPSLAGLIFWPPSLGRAPKYFCNKMPIPVLSNCSKSTFTQDLVGASEQRRRDGTKRLCALELDNEVEPGVLFDGRSADLVPLGFVYQRSGCSCPKRERIFVERSGSGLRRRLL